MFTHTHPGHLGVRHLASGLLKVYYLPVPVLTASATLPNFLLFLPYLRHLLVRESIDVVHGHASLSSLALEGALHAPLLGIRTVWTDHSLFGFGDAVGVLTNKLLRGCLRNLDAGICVSHTGSVRPPLSPSASLRPDTDGKAPQAREHGPPRRPRPQADVRDPQRRRPGGVPAHARARRQPVDQCVLRPPLSHHRLFQCGLRR